MDTFKALFGETFYHLVTLTMLILEFFFSNRLDGILS